jgi:alanine racemase
MQHDVYVEVNKSALKHNLQEVSKLAAAPVLAVVKANAYGHGMVETARTFVESDAWGVAVTRLSEASEIRQAGIEAPILVFSPILPKNAVDAVEMNVISTVDRLDCGAAISRAAVAAGVVASIHVKVDTGMGRLGVESTAVLDFFQGMLALPGLAITGIYTHFACSPEKDPQPTQQQLKVFKDVLDILRAENIDYGTAHCANSAAVIRFPETRMDLVRPGTLLYGQYPSTHVPKPLKLQETWKLKARIVDIRELPAGRSIGYGAEYTTKSLTKMAVVPIGWADGYSMVPDGPVYRQGIVSFALRKLRRQKHVLVSGKRANVLGRVSMQMTCLNITGIDGVQIGDSVEIPAMRIPIDTSIPRVYVDF